MGAAMQAIVIHEFGNPSVLNLEDVPEPTLEAGEITIKVRAATVNQTLDVALRAGKYARRPPLPHVLGSDAAGEIAAVAADVKTLKAGDRVEVDTPLLTLETEKATMDVPSPVAGVIERYTRGAVFTTERLVARLFGLPSDEVARAAVEAGAEIVNDVSGFRWDREMLAEFSSDEEAWLSYRLIDSCVDESLEYVPDLDRPTKETKQE